MENNMEMASQLPQTTRYQAQGGDPTSTVTSCSFGQWLPSNQRGTGYKLGEGKAYRHLFATTSPLLNM